ncbi:MAG: hypothetical protein Kow0029_21380 [Candidatus Rifleibacteriota bacterium]
MKKIFTIMTVFFTAWACSRAYAAGPVWGVVDGSLLIGGHPLMRQFDFRTKRFVDTVSQPRESEDTTEFVARLRKKLTAIENTIRRLDQNYAGKLSGSGLSAKKTYLLYWKKRESLRFYSELLREAISQASTQGNFYLNMPSDWTLIPVVRGIASTIREVCEYLRQKNELEGVLDSSVFSLKTDYPAAELNQHWAIWRGDAKAIEQLQPVCNQLMYSIREAFPRLRQRPFVAGVKDLNNQAIEMLRSISMPNAELPEDLSDDK